MYKHVKRFLEFIGLAISGFFGLAILPGWILDLFMVLITYPATIGFIFPYLLFLGLIDLVLLYIFVVLMRSLLKEETTNGS